MGRNRTPNYKQRKQITFNLSDMEENLLKSDKLEKTMILKLCLYQSINDMLVFLNAKDSEQILKIKQILNSVDALGLKPSEILEKIKSL